MVAGIQSAVLKERPKIVFLASPNNPDGSMLSERELLEVLALPVLVVLDEAYIEFSAENSRLKWVIEHENLIVLRTFSKSAGLAGELGTGECGEGFQAVSGSGISVTDHTNGLQGFGWAMVPSLSAL
jgi:Aminotransferase class I and II